MGIFLFTSVALYTLHLGCLFTCLVSLACWFLGVISKIVSNSDNISHKQTIWRKGQSEYFIICLKINVYSTETHLNNFLCKRGQAVKISTSRLDLEPYWLKYQIIENQIHVLISCHDANLIFCVNVQWNFPSFCAHWHEREVKPNIRWICLVGERRREGGHVVYL